ncbi:serine/threonine-protein kinase PknK, partial [Microcoleus sp. C2C3]|uniref:serine/threonine-protein kinase PknK n=1 Tax=unclassified Microcoleus TaxID=2642155 RepID=UPI002FD1529C
MLSIPGVATQTLLYESANSLVYRAIREADNQPIILKLLKESYPTPQELVRYRTEYRITQELKQPGVVRVYDLQKYQNSLVMFVEDFGGESLTIWMQQRKFTLEEFLLLAIATTEILGQIHSANIIHKDINPSNIVYNPETKQLKIIDFGISTQLTRETPILKNPGVLEGTLAYISPEQTGRMNRALDYRSDFYSLGVTFYELLTGKLPFETEDTLELVHCHIARQPIPPQEIAPRIPLILSQIVSKLMAKNAENRYQTTGGIKHDLEMCLVQLQETDSIEEFDLGTRDITDRFLIPEKLYGRETEVAQLLAAFERVSTGSAEMMLVAGFSGIGKTSVVNEVHKPIARQRGYFIKGKYDQFGRNIPFSAFVQAFRELMGQLLSESDAQLQTWKTRILTAVGDSGQVLIEVIPELERIIGPQSPALELSGSAAQNRFNLLMEKFVQVFTTAEHPLVMFLDDLQWADSASLKLLQLLMQDRGHLLVLGAYRDNEVSAAHPFMLTVDEIIKSGAVVNTITLQPLSLADLNQLVADTLICDLSLAGPLTELVYQKTKGNPFFSTQFLKALYEDGQIIFDPPVSPLSKGGSKGGWQCDIARVTFADASDVVEFMAVQLQKLPAPTQEVLKLAACIGAQFDLDTLAIVSEELPEQTASALWRALQEELILPITEGYKCFIPTDDRSHTESITNPTYRFLHDRVQQAAYSLIPEEKKQATHLLIGQLLLQNSSNIEQDEKKFEIVRHLNHGKDLITQPSERQALAELNLVTGRKAKTSNAYAAATVYLQTAMGLLTTDCWKNQYELTLNIYIATAEAEYLNLNFKESLNLAELALNQANSLLEKLKIYELKMQIHMAKLEMVTAVDIGLEVLEKLTISLLEIEVDKQLIIDLPNLEDLDNLPVMTDPYKLAAMQILKSLCAPVFMARPEIFPQIIITMINLCLKYGDSAISSFAYGFYGLLLVGLGQLDRGYQAGLIALKLLNKFKDKELKAKVYNLFNANIRTWKEHARNSVDPLRQGVESGLEVGDLEWAGYCAANLCSYLFFTENNLEAAVQQQGVYVDLCINIKQEISIHFSQVWRQLGLNLQLQAADSLLLSGESFDEEKNLSRIIAAKSGTVLFMFYVAKTILVYLLGDSSQALKNVALAQEQAGQAFGFMQVVVLNFYHSLILLKRYAEVTLDEQKNYWKQVNVNQEKMKFWAESAPEVNHHRYELIEAEKARVLGINWQALELYERAIQLAKKNHLLNEEALANELAAKFYIERGKEKIAQTYMIEAYYCYVQWGATAKVKDLETRYPQLLKPIQPRNKNTQTTARVTTGSEFNLDITTVMKASQAISGEIMLDKLMSSLMKILIESAGAQRGYLILSSQEKLLIEAEGTINSQQVTVLQSIPVETC